MPTRVPSLQPGDRLVRDEFERRYRATPGVKKAELLEGVVYMPSPARHDHGAPHTALAGWLAVYRAGTPGVDYGTDLTVRLDHDNEPQPDLLLRRRDGGTSNVDADGYVAGPPELAIEVALSSVSYDLHQKKHVYRRAGVAEYLVVRVQDAVVDWFALRQGEYERLPVGGDGILRSAVFPGLWLDVDALLRCDDAQLHAVAAQGLATADHARFVDGLRG
ncbi:MAG: Uma2 family endonuclease [Planctomycetota bacterium]